MPKGVMVPRTSPVHQVRFSDEENASPLDVTIEEEPDEEEEEEVGEGGREEAEDLDTGPPRTPEISTPPIAPRPLVVPPTHPQRLSSLPPPPPGLSSSLAAMYSARLGSDADYLRYKACKDSAESFYSRLATLSALHSYGYYLHPLTLPSLMSQYQQRLQPNPQPQPHPQHPAPSMAFNGNLSPCSTSSNNSLSSPISLANQNGLNTTSSTLSTQSNHSHRSSVKRKPLEDSANHSTTNANTYPSSSTPIPNKKAKISPLPKRKVSRKLAFDDFKTSPVSGTLIRELAEGEEVPAIRKGDIDPEFNVVEITEEAKAELAKIENNIGDFICRLCKEVYEDAFGLAQHRCSMIVHVEYRCPECDKIFNCPANLASHRRWHKPRNHVSMVTKPELSSPHEDGSNEGTIGCEVCGKKFKKVNSLKKHYHHHHPSSIFSNNNSNNNNNNNTNNNNIGPLPEEEKSPQSSGYSIVDLLSPSRKSSSLSPKHACPTCNMDFDSLEDLDLHHRRVHDQGSPSPSETLFPCKLCPQVFETLSELTVHAGKAHFPALASNFSRYHHGVGGGLVSIPHQPAMFPQGGPLLSIAALSSRS